ncbi:MAG: hypothetical protein KME27_06665 [Lyngbya sp. HA4199-MV5]|nr:hypothetical protein [Lyngbya sp. HA4199-MV5]
MLVPESTDSNKEKERFFYPTASYRGEFTPEHLAFNANLQEFAQRVSIICGLETGGKVPPGDAYKEIKKLWKQLKESKDALLEQTKRDRPELPEE